MEETEFKMNSMGKDVTNVFWPHRYYNILKTVVALLHYEDMSSVLFHNGIDRISILAKSQICQFVTLIEIILMKN